MKKLLLVNDMAGYGKVALSAMIPVLSHMKYEVFNLPTALVSNTLDYGKFDILETTEYMKNTIRIWDELGFSFDAVSTGFIVSEEQTKIICEFCKKCSAKGSVIFTDPIMGDDGHLYNGISDNTVKLMRRLVSTADFIIPNYTEAVYLADREYKPDGMTLDELYGLINELRTLGAKSVVITSCIMKDNGRKSVVGFDAAENRYFTIAFDEIPVRFPGTGDIFSSVFMGKVLEGMPVKKATETAMLVVRNMIEMNKDNFDKYKGIPVECYLEAADQ